MLVAPSQLDAAQGLCNEELDVGEEWLFDHDDVLLSGRAENLRR